ncbi:MAG: tail fiber domain-containing protein [Bacteroidota bacterium]
MKRISLFLLLICTVLSLQAQAPGAFKFQAVARDASGDALANTNVALRISVRAGTATGAVQYQERHTATTTDLGVFDLAVGNGTPIIGNLFTVDWADDDHWLQVELDPDGGTNYTDFGSSQLLSVPYALHAAESANVNSTDELQFLSLSGSTLTLSNGGGSVDLSGLGGSSLWSDGPAGSINYVDGDVGIGTDSPEAKLTILANTNSADPHIRLLEEGNDFARLELGNAALNSYWHVAGLASNSISSARLNFFYSPMGGTGFDRMTITGEGRVGINNSSPDEDFVIGTNLGSGWVFPAATVGSPAGGAIQVGTPTIRFSSSASTTFNRTRLIASDGNGFGQGLIEMRTRQLNVGVSPGVNTTRTYPLRLVQNTSSSGGEFGFIMINGTTTNENWEMYVGTTASNSGGLALYHNDALRGTFNAASGNYSALSDARLKTNIRAISGVLPLLSQLQAQKYNYLTDPDQEFIGFLAQDVQQVFPTLVTESKGRDDDDATLLVDYNQLTVLAISAIQEQQQVIEQQNNTIAQQTSIIDRQAQELADMRERLERIEALLDK